jgi:ubiquinone/menaquinone biosynthesis C-methylase UbiE
MNDILFELFEHIPRQGPGTADSTRRAYSIIHDLPEEPDILDIGCGTGTQTVELARISHGNINAVDIHEPFLHALEEKVVAYGSTTKITTHEASMFELPFENGSFDLIWSEGAIYIMGFRNGLASWKRLLRPNGYIVVSELSWLKDFPPAEVRTFWQSAYPEMGTMHENIHIIEESGYRLRGFFTLPEDGWWANFYDHLDTRIGQLRSKYNSNPDALSVLDEQEQEIQLYRKYSEWYGYVFYIMKNTT